MKVLLLHQHFKSPQRGGAIRSYYLAKALVDRGAQVVVITAHNQPTSRRESLEGIEVHYLPVPYDNRYGFFRRIRAFYGFAQRAATFAGRHADADLCYAISTPLTVGIAAMRIQRKFRIPYIFEVGDLWPDAPIEMGFIRNRILQRGLYALEKRIYRNARAVVALSTAIADAIHGKLADQRVEIIPNMADLEFYKPEEKLVSAGDKYGVRDKFVVSYIGAVGIANGLHYFLDCAAASQQHGLPVHFFLCGDGAMLDELNTYAQRLQLNNLTFVPFQNRQGVRELMNVTDANFISYLPLKILETGSPNKYFDGLAAGKLTVINFGGWIKDEIESAACGISVDPGDAEDFVKQVKPFVDDARLLSAYQQRGRELAERKYARRKLVEKAWEIVRDAATTRGG